MADSRRDVEHAYNRWASSYDDDVNVTRDLDAVVLKRAQLPLAGCTVLEVGAGTGKNTGWIAEQAAAVVALDLSDAMLARAARRVRRSNVRFVRCDLRARWPVADASVDVVIGNLVLEHIKDIGHVFAEVARGLRVDGVAYFAELHPARQQRGSQAQFTDVERSERVLVPAFVHSREEYASAAARAGFDSVEWGEHVEDGASNDALPRLLTMRMRR